MSSDIDDILINQIEDRHERERTMSYISKLNKNWQGYNMFLASHQGLSGTTADDLSDVTPTPDMLDLTRSFSEEGTSVTEQSERSGGWSSPYYMLPEGARELGDLIEHKDMNFNVGNIFKAAYRLGDKKGTTRIYDLEKIIWFAERELIREELKESRDE